MLPIHIFEGLERYVLVRRGTAAGSDARSEAVSPAQARAVLESALRRRDPQLMRRLATLLHMSGEDPDAVASRAMARISSTGTLGGDLMLMRMSPVETGRGPRQQLPELPEQPEERPVAEPEEEAPPIAKTTIRISLFFDGTANNRANTRARLNNTQAYKDHEGEGSFENDYSNVSKLEALYIGDSSFAHKGSIYVEGIGTQNLQGDSNYGMGLGLGDTGVPAKVHAGVDELLRRIRRFNIPGGEIIERIHVDAFGFSRGAAAARHFVHYVLTENPLKPRIEALGHTVELFEVNFIGLFDTVASYGIVHSNDTSDLNLDAIRSAQKVVQLAAAEEHRANFRLTNIASAGGKGVEVFLPGVHSDVGGGYTDFYAEVDLQILDFDQFSNDALVQRFERERQWLIDSGWYRANEIQAVNFWNELKVTRRGIRNQYSRIPLKLMADFATQTGLSFDPPTTHHPIPAALASIHAAVEAHVAADVAGSAASTAEHWINMRTPDYRTLRHDYLHFSSSYGGFNQPQWSNGSQMTGRRQRIVQAG